MCNIPHEIWGLIKGYLIDYKRIWNRKMKDIFTFINCLKPNIVRMSLHNPGPGHHVWSIETIQWNLPVTYPDRLLLYKTIDIYQRSRRYLF